MLNTIKKYIYALSNLSILISYYLYINQVNAQQIEQQKSSFISINYAKNKNDKPEDSKKFISINQTEQDNKRIDKVEKAEKKEEVEIFKPQPTIASIRANASKFSNISYGKKSLEPMENANSSNAIRSVSIDAVLQQNNLTNIQEAKSVLKVIEKYDKSENKNIATKSNTNTNTNTINKSSNNISNSNESKINNDYPENIVIPMIIDSAQYKNNSNKLSYAEKENSKPENKDDINIKSTILKANVASSGIPTNISNHSVWLPVDNAINSSSTYLSQKYASVSNASSTLINNAKSLLGIPYRYGGNTPNDGLDCSGFVRYVYYYTLGIALPRRSAEIGQLGTYIDLSSLKNGDLVFFNTRGRLSHLGIYVGDNKFIHAPSTGSRIRIDSLSNSYWSKRYANAKRLANLD